MSEMMISHVERRSRVAFPAFTGERVYMRPFTQSEGLPPDLARWQETVDQMLDGVTAPGPIYLMVDQASVDAGAPHRRPGIHVDGYWMPEIKAHGTPSPGGHGTWPSPWKTGHGHALSGRPEGLIIASDLTAARAYDGAYDPRLIGDGGDCSGVNTDAMLPVSLEAGYAFAGDVWFLHESLPVEADCLRTVVRLNVPGWRLA